ncbi:hypothetical protein [Paenibacillus taichungensis]|uniref:hypothetical protein n=1 Tax=Paenibacillus taichungensis TaxID=484184 RepID=UPI001FEB34E8|nr:hypothetical protein [Paenibacillus taichungensis]
MPDRTALSMEIAFGVAAAQYLAVAFQTATTDRDKEFACYANLEETHDVQIYFADPSLPGNEVQIRMQTAYFVSFFLRAQTLLKY